MHILSVRFVPFPRGGVAATRSRGSEIPRRGPSSPLATPFSSLFPGWTPRHRDPILCGVCRHPNETDRRKDPGGGPRGYGPGSTCLGTVLVPGPKPRDASTWTRGDESTDGPRRNRNVPLETTTRSEREKCHEDLTHDEDAWVLRRIEWVHEPDRKEEARKGQQPRMTHGNRG